MDVALLLAGGQLRFVARFEMSGTARREVENSGTSRFRLGYDRIIILSSNLDGHDELLMNFSLSSKGWRLRCAASRAPRKMSRAVRRDFKFQLSLGRKSTAVTQSAGELFSDTFTFHIPLSTQRLWEQRAILQLNLSLAAGSKTA